MSVTSGFFNSLNGDRRYNAEQMSAIFDGIINDGVFASVGTSFGVKADTDYNITVGVGRAWFNSTWLYNDSVLPLTVDVSELLLDRYDAVVIEIDRTESVRSGSIKIVKGEASSNPQYPTLTKTTGRWQYPLAYIYRKAGTTVITQSDITSMIGTSSCPYITGILEVMNIDNIVAQWESQWNDWTEAERAEWNEWSTALETEMGTWCEERKTTFDTWFAEIRDILSGETLSELTDRVLKLEDGTTPAGDSNKLGGKGAGEYRQKTSTRISTLPTPPTEEADYFVSNGDSSLPYPYGHLEIRYGYSEAEFIATFKSSVGEKKEYKNYYTEGKWFGWFNSADGGNANTVQGYATNTDGKKGLVAILTDYGIIEIGSMIDFHAGEGQDFKARLAVNPDTGKLYIWDENNVISDIATTADLANYFPNTGGQIDDFVDNVPLTLNSANDATVFLQFKSGNTSLGFLGFDSYSKTPLFMADDGSQVVALLHSGNVGEHALSISGGILTGGLGVNNGLAVLSADGNHAAIMSRDTALDDNNGRALMLFNTQYRADDADCLQIWKRVGGVVTPLTILHSGNITHHTAGKAIADANGNNIASTYMTKAESAKVLVSQTPLTAAGSIRVW